MKKFALFLLLPLLLLTAGCFDSSSTPQAPTAYTQPAVQYTLGLTLTDTSTGLGMEVLHVEAGGAGDVAGIQPGDVLLKFNDTAICSYENIISFLNGGAWEGCINVTVIRGDESVKLVLVPAIQSPDIYEIPQYESVETQPSMGDAVSGDTPTAPVGEAPMTEAAFLDEVYWHLYWLNECCIENFGASTDRSQAYARVYSDENAMLRGEAPIDVVPRSALTSVTDPIDANLYPIDNYTSNAQIRATLEGYMTADLVDLLFSDPFQEFGGKLYYVEGGRGSGAEYYDVLGASVMELGTEYCTVLMDKFYMDEPDGQVMVLFRKTNGSWYITEYQSW